MAVYDDQEKHQYDPKDKDVSLKSLSEDELRDLEQKYSTDDDETEDFIRSKYGGFGNKVADEAGRGGMGKKLRENSQEVELEEDEKLKNQLGGYYNQDDMSGINANADSLLKNKKARKGIVATVAIGIPAIVFAAAFLPNLLGLFKIENFVQNIEASTFARLNATFDRRSDKWIKSYIALRMSEIDGEANPGRDTLYFRANKVDTDNPIRDWYRTMRTSNFEKNVFEKNGIRFTTAQVTQADGSVRFKPAIMVINDVPVASLADAEAVGSLTDTRTIDNLLNTMDPRINDYIDTELFANDKDARRAIKTAVNDNTQAWRVFQRRHLRKDIQNMTGVRDWRLFAGTRDKIDEKTSSIQRAIMRKVLPDNRTGQLIGCIFTANSCPGKSDPASDDAKTGKGTVQVGQPDPDVDAEGNPTLTDEAGNAIDTAGAGDLGEEAGEAISETIGEAADGEVAESIRKTFLQQITSLIGNPYTKVWSTMKKLAKVHEFFSNGVLSSFVTNARRSQYMAANASMIIALSQLKSGDIRGTETLFNTSESASGISGFAQVSANIRDGQVNEFMSFFDGAEKSEGWILYSGGRKGNSDTVSAQSPMTRDVYCTESTEAQKKAAPVQYLCPDDGLNGGSAAEIEDAYNRTAGKILYPIWKAVDEVKTLPIIGGVINYASDKFEQLSDAAIGPVVDAILETTGLNKTIETVAVAGVTKALEFAGAGVKYTPTSPGQLNYMLLGSAASAEASARQGGAAAATTLSTEYSNKIAAEWQKEKEENMTAFDRFVSLSNPKSFASNALMAMVTSTPSEGLKNVADPMQSLNNFAKSLSGTAFAATDTGINASSVADWGGVQKYDYPQQCIDLDPLAPGYFQNATNAPASVPRDRATLTNPDVFWEKVYATLPTDNKAAEAQAAGIYNCALLDQRVMGGVGYTSGGYENDGGLGDTPQSSAAASAPSTSGLVPGQDIPAEDTSAMSCPINANVTDRGVVEGWKNFKPYNIRLCRVHGVDVNAVVAKAYDEMFTAMKAAGFTINGTLGWRSMEAQQTLFARAGAGTAAKPGNSNHQYGTAADIVCNDALGNAFSPGVRGTRYRDSFYTVILPNYPCIKWVSDNSAKYGLLLQCNGVSSNGREIRENSGGCEAWHISPTGG